MSLDHLSTMAEGQDLVRKMEANEAANADNHSEHSDKTSVASDGTNDSDMEAFDTYQLKIKQLLDTIGLNDFSVNAIQHGYGFMNCVYALTSLKDPMEQYILRVAIYGDMRESDGLHETLGNDIALLGYLKDILPVPRVKAYSLTTDNVLEAAYTIQTRIPGESLNNLWAKMARADKTEIVDEFIKLLVKMESVEFSEAGNFAASTLTPVKSEDFFDIEAPLVRTFKPYNDGNLSSLFSSSDQAGSDLVSFLTWHLRAWMQEEIDRDQHELSCSINPKFEKLLKMLEDINNESSFKDQPFPIQLHHWDLEPRNLMVSKASGSWRICGIIDWDDALALPRPLARVPPRWIWHFPDEEPGLEDGFLNDDQFADPELSHEGKALKAYFDMRIEALLPGYCEDAYGRGRWLRRIWHFAKDGAFKTWEWDFLDQIPKDWAARPKPEAGKGALQWIRTAMKVAQLALRGRFLVQADKQSR